MKIEIKELREGAIPNYATEGSAGLDLKAFIKEDYTLFNNESILIPSGIAINIKDPTVAAIILPRSGLGARYGIVIGNLVGLIDSDYQGEIMISVWNRSDEAYVIRNRDRIAQLVFIPVVRPSFEVVSDFEPTKRGEGGLGHTGK